MKTTGQANFIFGKVSSAYRQVSAPVAHSIPRKTRTGTVEQQTRPVKMQTYAAQPAGDRPRLAVDFARCWCCGRRLAPSATRPRETCSLVCSRRRGYVLRKIARRRAWIATWKRSNRLGSVNPATAVDAIEHLTRTIQRLEIPEWQQQRTRGTQHD